MLKVSIVFILATVCCFSSRPGDGSGNPPGCTQPDRDGTWKVENCTRNSGSNEVAISLLEGLADLEEHQITRAPDLETAVEYLPASFPSSLSGPPPPTAAGSRLIGSPTTPKGGPIGSVRPRRKWHPFPPALTGEASIDVYFDSDPFDLGLAALLDWVMQSARAATVREAKSYDSPSAPGARRNSSP